MPSKRLMPSLKASEEGLLACEWSVNPIAVKVCTLPHRGPTIWEVSLPAPVPQFPRSLVQGWTAMDAPRGPGNAEPPQVSYCVLLRICCELCHEGMGSCPEAHLILAGLRPSPIPRQFHTNEGSCNSGSWRLMGEGTGSLKEGPSSLFARCNSGGSEN